MDNQNEVTYFFISLFNNDVSGFYELAEKIGVVYNTILFSRQRNRISLNLAKKIIKNMNLTDEQTVELKKLMLNF